MKASAITALGLLLLGACTTAHPPESLATLPEEETESSIVKTDRLGTRTCHTEKGVSWPDLLPQGALTQRLTRDPDRRQREQNARDRTQCWLSYKLLALEEASLLPLDPDKEVYRFTWIPSFHGNRVIRVEHWGNIHSLHVKVEGTADGALSMDRRVLLTPTQWEALQQRLEQAGFWTLERFTLPHSVYASDGASWLFEGGRQGRYRALDIGVHGPDGRTGPFHDLGAFLVELSGIPVTDDTPY
ncbi:hypothetical protein JYK02_00925 [Corallococcus macrosporus]|uniref:Lipoprotein n=1 Tax=Corallococcus macrosporus TaxID=35 RepID=A0ABS3D5Y8_9BACT|nr:hypothetical protein [Corallococcus macrosporus]MBN8226067.1 hypothetical protein [Corallococcus macrosporus]